MRMPIHWAASGGHTEIVDFLLNFHVPVDVRDEVFYDIRRHSMVYISLVCVFFFV